MKALNYILTTFLAAGLTFSLFSHAEAATLALIPLVNNVAGREDLSAVYYDRAVEATKLTNEYEISDSANLDNALSKYVKMGQLPDKSACEKIANEGNVDVVFAMQIDDMNVKELYNQGDMVVVSLKGKCVSYNVLTGKYFEKNIVEEDKKEGALLARYDVSKGQFASSVTREVKKALGIKKITFEKPHISKSGLKGDRR